MGLLALIIAILNYVNLASSQSALRVREIAMRKVLGADRTTLARQFLAEAMVTAAISALVGLIIAVIALPLVNAAGALSLRMSPSVVLPLLFLIVVTVGTAGSFYPAFLLSRTPAAAALASAQAPGGGRVGARTRETLVVLQFAFAAALVISTVLLVAQARHVRQTDLGFEREGLIIIPSIGDRRIAEGQARSMLTALRRIPDIVSVGVANTGAGGDGEPGLDVLEMPGQSGLGPSLRLISVGPQFFGTYRPRLLAGRLFSDTYGIDNSSDPSRWNLGRNILINRKAVSALGFQSPAAAIGKTVGAPRPRTIIGVIDELRFFSPRLPDEPTYYIYFRDRIPSGAVATVRHSGDTDATLAAIETTWRQLVPEVPLIAEPARVRLARLYEADDRAARLFAIGAALAIVIACLGLWGLATFNAAQRVREIGIRKTLGASSADIVQLLVVQFLRPVIVGSILACPLAFFAISTWLAGFGDRITLSPTYFAVPSASAVAIAALAVLRVSLRASRAVPAKSLRCD